MSIAEVVSFATTVGRSAGRVGRIIGKRLHHNLGKLQKTLPRMRFKSALHRTKRQQQINLKQTRKGVTILLLKITLIISLTLGNVLGVAKSGIFPTLPSKGKILEFKKARRPRRKQS